MNTDEWKLATWPDGHKCEKHYVNGQYVGEWRTLTGRVFHDSDTVHGSHQDECDHQYAEVGVAPLGVRCIKCGHFVGAWE